MDEFGRGYFPRAVYEEARAQKEFDIQEFTYASDGLPVSGMLIKPKTPGAREWQVIIFAVPSASDSSANGRSYRKWVPRTDSLHTYPCGRQELECGSAPPPSMRSPVPPAGRKLLFLNKS